MTAGVDYPRPNYNKFRSVASCGRTDIGIRHVCYAATTQVIIRD
jgi:hypothetical protein